MSGVNVLTVMDRAARRYAAGSKASISMRDSRAAVKELIEAVEAYWPRLQSQTLYSAEGKRLRDAMSTLTTTPEPNNGR